MQSFRISYKDIFDTTLHKDLKEGGDQIPVTNKNKQVILWLTCYSYDIQLIDCHLDDIVILLELFKLQVRANV